MIECPTPCDDDCDADCHEYHAPYGKREHEAGSCQTDDIPYNPEANIVVSKETYEWLLEELERPARVDPKLVALFRQARRVIRHE